MEQTTTAPEQAQHTAGPWRVSADDTTLTVYNAHGRAIAYIESTYDEEYGVDWHDDYEAQANAALIAAAPDLLAACKAALDDLGPRCGYNQPVTKLLAAAIAKAEGSPAPAPHY